jgi:hypothetical protein
LFDICFFDCRSTNREITRPRLATLRMRTSAQKFAHGPKYECSECVCVETCSLLFLLPLCAATCASRFWPWRLGPAAAALYPLRARPRRNFAGTREPRSACIRMPWPRRHQTQCSVAACVMLWPRARARGCMGLLNDTICARCAR